MATHIKKPPRRLCHYTNKAGYESILASKKLRASTIAGVRNTHYGKGVYFASIYPEDMYALGTYNTIEWIFGSVSGYAVERMAYYLEIEIDPEWFVADAFDPERGPVKEIWLAPDWAGEHGEISIRGRIARHGKTSVGHALDYMKHQSRAASDFAFQLKQEHPHEVVLYDQKTGQATSVGHDSFGENHRAA